MKSISTSVRLPSELSDRLAREAQRSGRGKNAIITQALEQYLNAADKASLDEQIRRASIAIAARDERDIEAWLEAAAADVWPAWDDNWNR